MSIDDILVSCSSFVLVSIVFMLWIKYSITSHRCDPQWSPHSLDLNPPDFYLWGYLKDRVYVNNPQTIPDLKAAITAAIRAIPRE